MIESDGQLLLVDMYFSLIIKDVDVGEVVDEDIYVLVKSLGGLGFVFVMSVLEYRFLLFLVIFKLLIYLRYDFE